MNILLAIFAWPALLISFRVRFWRRWHHAHCRERAQAFALARARILHNRNCFVFCNASPLIPQVLATTDEAHLQRVASDLCVEPLCARNNFRFMNESHFPCRSAAGIAFSAWNEQPENYTTALATKPLLKVAMMEPMFA